MTQDLMWMDATAQAELVRTGQASPLELVDAAIARIEAVNPRINAVITPLFDKARAQAQASDLSDGPFRGVPFLVKDLFLTTEGDPYYAGTTILKKLEFVAPHDSYLAAKFRRAGFIFVGKTNTPELGTAPATEPASFGPTRNPWNTGHSTGGSSGGSAAAVAAGMVPAAHANDGGGSIRVPASECGVVGLKPSRGRTSQGPDYGEALCGFVNELVVSRTVRDTAAILDCVHGPMPGDPYTAPPPQRRYAAEVGADPGRLRIGILTENPLPLFPVHDDCVAAAREAAGLLESLGHTVEESYPTALNNVEIGEHLTNVWCVGTRRDLDRIEEMTGTPITQDDVDLRNWTFAEIGQTVSAAAYLKSAEYIHLHTRNVAAWWAEGYDLLLTPTLGEPPPPLGEFNCTPEDPMAAARRSLAIVPFTQPFNITGQPAISLPLAWNDAGLPIGVQLVAAYGREDLLLRVAAQLETARPWADKKPPVHA